MREPFYEYIWWKQRHYSPKRLLFWMLSGFILSLIVSSCLPLQGTGLETELKGKIAFVSLRDTGFGICVVDANDSHKHQLTSYPTYAAADYTPRWSPDGMHITFVSNRDGNNEIYVMDAVGANLTRLTNHPADDGQPTWSPDGMHIAFDTPRDGNLRKIYVMDADGTNLTRLTNHSSNEWYPAWSPDGSHIAFVSNRDNDLGEIYVMDADGSNVRRLTYSGYEPSFFAVLPAWSPDGAYIAFTGVSSPQMETDIYVIRADGSEQVLLVEDGKSPSWTE